MKGWPTWQTTLDDKHKLIIDYKLTNTNDSKAGEMLQSAQTILQTTGFTAPLRQKDITRGSETKTQSKWGRNYDSHTLDLPYAPNRITV
ncbi:MAG: hypothetical protein IPG29_17170 [Sphingobacteriales bacterium]|nr:hypothetical protein [Sphingobacteriales bacterium]